MQRRLSQRSLQCSGLLLAQPADLRATHPTSGLPLVKPAVPRPLLIKPAVLRPAPSQTCAPGQTCYAQDKFSPNLRHARLFLTKPVLLKQPCFAQSRTCPNLLRSGLLLLKPAVLKAAPAPKYCVPASSWSNLACSSSLPLKAFCFQGCSCSNLLPSRLLLVNAAALWLTPRQTSCSPGCSLANLLSSSFFLLLQPLSS